MADYSDFGSVYHEIHKQLEILLFLFKNKLMTKMIMSQITANLIMSSNNFFLVSTLTDDYDKRR